MPGSVSGMHLTTKRGFSLVELLVVIAITGVIVTAVVLSVNLVDLERSARDKARLMRDLIRLSCEQALSDNAPRAIHIGLRGYQFLAQSGAGDWQLDRTRVFRPRDLGSELAFTLTLEERAVALTGPLELTPHLICFSSGEMTPFSVDITDTQGRPLEILEGRFNGEVIRKTVEPANADGANA